MAYSDQEWDANPQYIKKEISFPTSGKGLYDLDHSEGKLSKAYFMGLAEEFLVVLTPEGSPLHTFPIIDPEVHVTSNQEYMDFIYDRYQIPNNGVFAVLKLSEHPIITYLLGFNEAEDYEPEEWELETVTEELANGESWVYDKFPTPYDIYEFGSIVYDFSLKDWAVQKVKPNQTWDSIRSVRNFELDRTDGYFNLPADKRTELDSYRKLLRDLPETWSCCEKEPWKVQMPTPPDWLSG